MCVCVSAVSSNVSLIYAQYFLSKVNYGNASIKAPIHTHTHTHTHTRSHTYVQFVHTIDYRTYELPWISYSDNYVVKVVD